MTSPDSVGSVSVELEADARALSKSLKAEVEKAFKKLDTAKPIQDSVGRKPIKVPVQTETDTGPLEEKVRKTRMPKVKVPLDPDTDSIPEKVKKTRVPKVSVPLDPLLQAFQQEVRRQTAALARQVNVNVPVEGDTSGLRTQLGAQLAAIQAQTKVKVPTEPGDKAAYEARLKAQLAEVAARVKQTVKVEAQVDKKGVTGLASSLKALPTSGVGLLGSAFQTLSSAMAESSNAAVRFGGTVAGSLSTVAGPVGAAVSGFALLAGGITGIVAAATVAIPAISALAGAVAALPGILAGAGAGFGALSLGFKGISDAFKPKAGGGGGGGGEDAASRARRIAGAERGVEAARRAIAAATRGVASAERGYQASLVAVADAQKRAAQAQAAVNRARVEAKERIEDLTRSLAGARLSEEDAALGVTEALRELNAARESGILPDMQRADLQYRQAIQTLEEAKDTTEDLGAEQADASKKGVEGSDLVQGALEDQAEALKAVKAAQVGVIDAQDALISANDGLKSSYDGLKSAQDALAEAQKKAASGGGGGALAEVVKLAPAAQKFVNAIKALRPAFEALRLDVQNRLFKDLDDTIRQLATAYEQPLRQTLGSYADTFNKFFRDLGAGIAQPKFITDLQAGAESGRRAFEQIGSAITTSLVPAFGALSKAAGPFIETLGQEIADIVTEFSNWVLEGEKTGGLKTFFQTASEALHDIFTTGKEVGKIIGNIFRILTNGNGKQDKSAIDSFNDGLKSINRFLADPANQAAIASFIDDIKQFFTDLKSTAGQVKRVLDVLFPADAGAKSKKDANTLGSDIGKALVSGLISGAISQSGFWLEFAADQFLNGPFSLIGAIKRVLGIQSPSTVMAEIGGDLIAGLMQGLTDSMGGLKTKAVELKNKISEGLGNARDFLVRKGQDFATGLRNGLQSAQSSVRAKAGELKTRVSDAFSNAGTLLNAAGRNLTAGLSNGMTSLQNTLSTRAQGLRNTVSNAFRNAGSLLTAAGRAITNSLQAGIASKVPTLGQYLNQLGAYIQSKKGPIDKDRKLLIPQGAAIMDGLIGGIASKRDALGAQLSDLTGMVGNTAFADLGTQADAALTSSLAVASAQRVLLGFEPGFTGDWLQDGLKRNIKFRNQGNVVAALGSS